MTPEGISIGFTAPRDRARVAAFEELPIDSLWVGGHVASPNPTPEAMVALARLAAQSERVRIGTSIVLLPLYPPAVIAKQVADIDRDADGRVVFGVGIGGEYPAEFRACHVPIRERGPRTDEAIEVLRLLWTAEEVSRPGRFYPLESVRIHPAPAQAGGPPIVVAGRKEPAMRRAALRGDGWMPYLYSPRRYADSATTIRRVAAEEGRDLASFEWYAFVFVNVDTDRDTARQAAARHIGGMYNQDFDQMIGSVSAVGTPDEVRTQLQSFVDAGVRHFIFSPATREDSLPMARLLSNEIVPALTTPRSVTSG